MHNVCVLRRNCWWRGLPKVSIQINIKSWNIDVNSGL